MLDLCPMPPEWRVDWKAIHKALPEVRALRGCPQNPRYHAEGDVWIHTRLVCEELAALPRFHALPPEEQEVAVTNVLAKAFGDK